MAMIIILICILPISICKAIIIIAECITDDACSDKTPFCVAGFCSGNNKHKNLILYSTRINVRNVKIFEIKLHPVFQNIRILKTEFAQVHISAVNHPFN